MEEDINIFVPEEKYLQIGKRRFKIWISSGISLKATDMFNKLKEKGSKENEAIKTDYDFFEACVDICLVLIKQKFKVMMKRSFSIKTIIDWKRREKLTRQNIMDSMEIKELNEFINNALEPIIGTKKKELERENKMADAMVLLTEKLSKEKLAELLESSLQDADTKKVM